MKRSEFIAGCLRVSERAGWCFIPVVGLGFTWVNCILFLKLTLASDGRWNPAQGALISGFCGSLAGGLFNVLLITIWVVHSLRAGS